MVILKQKAQNRINMGSRWLDFSFQAKEKVEDSEIIPTMRQKCKTIKH